MKNKILVVLTNTTHYAGTHDATGLWLGEATEFVAPLQAAGYAIDYVSPQGGFVPLDPRSMGARYTTAASMRVYESADFQARALTASLAPSQVDPHDYAAIYFTGGHGVMWDFPDDPALQNLTRQIYHQGGLVTSVCHGVAGLLNVTDDAGHYLIAGKTITGFTHTEELLAGKRRIVPFLNRQVAEAHGANFRQRRAYREYAVQDGQLITGQNPFSATAVARLVLAALPKQG